MTRTRYGVVTRTPIGATQTITYQSGSTAFHLVMTVLTAGLWLPIWACCRRTIRVRTR